MINRFFTIFSVCLLALSINGLVAQSTDVKYLELGEKKTPSISKILTWDSLGKRYQSRPEELDIKFTFHFLNKTKKEISIKETFTSCGCTVAKLPATPWIIKPGEKGSIPITMDVRGKSGVIEKQTTVVTDLGNVTLTTKVAIGAIKSANKPRKRSKEERAANLKLAAQNRQAIFQNNCVECHVEPTKGKRGRQLYATACGICHDATNRASFVTELRSISKGKTQSYWEQWVKDSKPGSLMPAFAKKHGGPLDDSQIRSLVAYLTRVFPREIKTKQAIVKSLKEKDSVLK
ncbi:MAG: hypothetical protein CMO44_10130 [Verrucomicrobiales bacterium]|nr:hypothetical protein [Verrucomicrobiales bacterium]